MKSKIKLSFYLVVTILFTLGLSLSLQNILAAWIPPTQTAPLDNTSFPVYASSSVLQKITSLTGGTGNGLDVFGPFLANSGAFLNNVGIGINIPTQKLDVVGNIKTNGDLMAKRLCDESGANCTDLPISSTGGGSFSLSSTSTDITGVGTKYLNCRNSNEVPVSCGTKKSTSGDTAEDSIGCRIEFGNKRCVFWVDENEDKDDATGYCYCTDPTSLGGGGALSCTTEISGGSSDTASVSCDTAAGYIMTGGGCLTNNEAGEEDLLDTYPSSANTWKCATSGSNRHVAAYARCCKGGGGSSQWAPSGMKITSATHDGNFGGMQAMYNWIQSNGCSGYHVCSSDEVNNYLQIHESDLVTYLHGIFGAGDANAGWFNGGSEDPISGSITAGNCHTWSTNNLNYLGYYLFLTTTNPALRLYQTNCNNSLNVLCCQ